ncbi:5'-3' exoribonuclease 2 [Synchiropus splendidus]|uniref:5'-3' exoribonuclease 2 n=1 Tax=Synchiropus splendidus TaxID=270530 RepID=UPI00237D9978|nr:5'-3' exoribonuclease 2 [Synchiropus splendidus]XP_053737580.1 5'-3' exoribonuclease 2 [Synchiropus splendidus]XP_053737581.1 5'-3' exoribonuclease 2 [Synchiropus splendidus]XP_053737582.1 5'-3' exoribonuclease 2 [Synchiropus splendidus]XP_053737583.1 5'-3' exoribonuclease 2 [Synchiropus splendidus]
MGVPAFFRWLSRKYPSIIVHCVEEKGKECNGVRIPVDTTKPNPNEVEFDNLYLDMNGIIHPCTHPEDKPAPKNEDEMMVAIFDYIDRLFNIVRPRRVLYMAIDGVAPRAKMNQQRSRRFRASKEGVELVEEKNRIREEIIQRGGYLPPEEIKERFDSNCITPGTEFMDNLAQCLRYYIADRLSNDPGWSNVTVFLSDASVPGEGEHKIMDFIRRQRAQPHHDPNTHHCLCGADADLIMLGLATHEPNFTIIREEFKPNKPRPCALCGQVGHELKECEGVAREKRGEHDEFAGSMPVCEQEFIFIRLCVLREYLSRELTMASLPFPFDFERSVDDWVFMCFFVGNDFLPHLPSLEIREGAIDRLVNIYKDVVHKTGGYLTEDGYVNLERVEMIMTSVGVVEDNIFKKRKEDDENFKKRMKEKKKRMKMEQQGPSFMTGGHFAPHALGRPGQPAVVHNARHQAYNMRMQSMESHNKDAAQSLKAMMKNGGTSPAGPSSDSRGQKRKAIDSDDEPEPEDHVRLWEDGWKQRYYKTKFDVDLSDEEFRKKVVRSYVEGLCWVLRYYYQGCASWKWFFPFHYAPFASDFKDIKDMFSEFEKDTKPFKPLEQLMGVFPAASGNFLPPTWRALMSREDSSIIDFYPDDFAIDLNGKKYAWQGVALLPFVDERRLRAALAEVYPDLTPEEVQRNSLGSDVVFLGKSHPLFDFIHELYRSQTPEGTEIPAELCHGIQGTLALDDDPILPDKPVRSPIPMLRDIALNSSIGIKFSDPQYQADFVFKAVLLSGAKIPSKVLKPEDFNQRSHQPWRPQLGFNPNRQQAHLDQSGFRALGHSVNRNHQSRGHYGHAPPPSSYSHRSYRPPHGSSCPPFQQHSRGSSHPAGATGSYQQRFSRQQQFQGGGTGWNRSMQSQPSAYQQNQNRQQSGPRPGEFQRCDEWRNRRDNRGPHSQGFSSARGFPPPPPSQRYKWQ